MNFFNFDTKIILKTHKSIFNSILSTVKSDAFDKNNLKKSSGALKNLISASRMFEMEEELKNITIILEKTEALIHEDDQKIFNMTHFDTKIKNIEFEMIVGGAKRENFKSHVDDLSSSLQITLLEDDVDYTEDIEDTEDNESEIEVGAEEYKDDYDSFESLKKSGRRKRSLSNSLKLSPSFRAAEEVGVLKTQILQIFLPKAVQDATNLFHVIDLQEKSLEATVSTLSRKITEDFQDMVTPKIETCGSELGFWKSLHGLLLSEESELGRGIKRIRKLLDENFSSGLGEILFQIILIYLF